MKASAVMEHANSEFLLSKSTEVSKEDSRTTMVFIEQFLLLFVPSVAENRCLLPYPSSLLEVVDR